VTGAAETPARRPLSIWLAVIAFGAGAGLIWFIDTANRASPPSQDELDAACDADPACGPAVIEIDRRIDEITGRLMDREDRLKLKAYTDNLKRKGEIPRTVEEILAQPDTPKKGGE
jgi:hypothetical protein